MPTYFDSSVVLSLVLGDAHVERARSLWSEDVERVSSILLEVECLTVLRRAKLTTQASRRVANERLDIALAEVTIKPLDHDIVEVLRATAALADCRALDAAHLATATWFQEGGGGDLRVATFDVRMAEVAARLGFVVAA